MATHQQNKISMDVAAENNSFESISFASFLSIQDMQPKSLPTGSIIQTKNQAQEFEFSSNRTNSSVHNSNNNSMDHISVSSGQLQLQAFLCQSKQANHNPVFEGATHRHSRNTTKMSSSQNHEERNQAKAEHTTSKSSFGQKMFRSLFFPCRECQAHKPSAKAHTFAEETVKSY